MYRCRQCKGILSDPVMRKNRCDGEIYPFCRRCGVPVDKPEEYCRRCGAELFPEQRAYELDGRVYCKECVSEVVI